MKKLAWAVSLLMVIIYAQACSGTKAPPKETQRLFEKVLMGQKKIAIHRGASIKMPQSLQKRSTTTKQAGIEDLLNSSASEYELWKRCQEKQIGIIVLKRPDINPENDNLLLKHRLGLGLDSVFFYPIWRTSKTTATAAVPSQMALTPQRLQSMFSFLRSGGEDKIAFSKGELPFQTELKLWTKSSRNEFATSSKDLFDALTKLRKRIGEISNSDGMTISIRILEPLMVNISKRISYFNIFVMGADGVLWKTKSGESFMLYPEDAMKQNLTSLEEIAEQIVRMKNGNPLSAAMRRKRKIMGRLKRKQDDNLKKVDTKVLFDRKNGKLYAVRSFMFAQSNASESPMPLPRKRYPSAGKDSKLSKETIEATFIAGAEFLLAHFNAATGMFDYEYYPQDAHLRRGRYNIIRHNLATFTLLQAYEITHDSKYLDTAHKAIEWTLALIEHDKEKRDICYLHHRRFDRKYKLGGAGTTLYAITEYTRMKEDAAFWAKAECLANFIVFMQKPTGEYESFYYPNNKPKKKRKPVYIYPGEADLALVSMYRRTGEERYIKTVEKSYEYYSKWFEENKRSYGMLGPYAPWAMSAFAEAYKVTGEPKYQEYVRKMGDWLLAKTYTKPESVFALDQFGAFAYSMKPSSAPLWNTGVYAEGMASLAQIDNAYLQPVAAMMTFIANLQIKKPDATWLAMNPAKAIGCVPETHFNYTCRLDYVYHPLSALHRVLVAGKVETFEQGAKNKIQDKVQVKPFVFPLDLPQGVSIWANPYETK